MDPANHGESVTPHAAERTPNPPKGATVVLNGGFVYAQSWKTKHPAEPPRVQGLIGAKALNRSIMVRLQTIQVRS